MNNQASEAVIVAVLAFVILFFINGNSISLDLRRFSLRKLLIVVTLVALVLGVISYAARN